MYIATLCERGKSECFRYIATLCCARVERVREREREKVLSLLGKTSVCPDGQMAAAAGRSIIDNGTFV